MNNETKIIGGIGLVTLILAVIGVVFLSTSQPNMQSSDGSITYQIDSTKGQKIGSDSAKVKLVEFADFQCPACGAAHPMVKQLVEEKKNDQNFQFTFRHFPLTQHKNARAAANAAEEAAAQGKFWEMEDKLFTTQGQWENLADPTDFFAGLAREIGIDEQKVRDAIKNNTYNDKIMGDIREGESINVNSTPTFYLNGQKLVLRSFNDLTQKVNEELQK